MRPSHSLALAVACTAALALAGCKQVDTDAEATDTTTEVQDSDSEEENVSFSIKAEGFSMEIDLPLDEVDSEDAKGHAEGLYPGSKVKGIAIESKQTDEGGETVVAIDFEAPASRDEVADWFVSKISKEGGSASRDGDTISGKMDDGQDYTLTLTEDGDKTKGILRIIPD
ncbi:hypothetical protein [Alterisphingorhabdus coralli]|uniref:Lipoprotein n=1 Tax=Alterisphingorhabdus coralli TaxID=3071408 RepID=A0AA97HZD0_9SPHN|nr:hypothetical protein [Parasphingorhabdus sp. SCSIO 66989]WOE74509.1 hypothetical protein RB602_11705 [Parasphingorhabdus sp. SCSIO 66989]